MPATRLVRHDADIAADIGDDGPIGAAADLGGDGQGNDANGGGVGGLGGAILAAAIQLLFRHSAGPTKRIGALLSLIEPSAAM